MEETKKDEIIIYKDASGPQITVKFEADTVWATLQQIADFFGRDKSVISRHLSAIFKEGELNKSSTVAKNATVQMEGGRAIERQIEYFNLDAIISVGYRVSSKVATKFRIWATQRLRDYLVKGFAVNEKRLKEDHDLRLRELERTTRIFQNLLENRKAEGYEKDLLKIISDYAHTWSVLNKYDTGELDLEGLSKGAPKFLDYQDLQKSIATFKNRLGLKKEAGSLFGQEVGNKFQALLGSIGQTYGGKELYKSLEEKAAHLLYFCIKDHPFADGNKRIGSLVFMLYLVQNNALFDSKTGQRKINDNALAALALLLAESKPNDKETMVKLIVNLINKR